MPKVDVLGIAFDKVTRAEAVERALLIAQNGPGYIATPNPEIVWICRKNQAAKRAVSGASLIVPDGIGVIYAAKIIGTPLKERVPGFDLASDLLPGLEARGLRLFLLGAKPGVAESAADALIKKYPNLIVCGTHDGYFQDDIPVVEAINRAGADVVFVCLGAPRQEIWMSENLTKTTAGLMIGLGGCMDVWAGTVDRAPDAWVRLNLEWLYRALKQPARFVRLAALPGFLLAAVAQRFKGGKA